jgi:hypothetical protein
MLLSSVCCAVAMEQAREYRTQCASKCYAQEQNVARVFLGHWTLMRGIRNFHKRVLHYSIAWWVTHFFHTSSAPHLFNRTTSVCLSDRQDWHYATTTLHVKRKGLDSNRHVRHCQKRTLTPREWLQVTHTAPRPARSRGKTGSRGHPRRLAAWQIYASGTCERRCAR